MKRYAVRLMPAAEDDLRDIYRYVLQLSRSQVLARSYVQRIRIFLETFRSFPMRGSVRHEIREGLRIVGFERTISVAFLVEEHEVIILRIAAGGQLLEL